MSHHRIRALLAAGILLVLGVVPAAATASTAPVVPGQVLVRFDGGADGAVRAAARRAVDAIGVHRALVPGVQVVRFDASRDPADVARRLAASDGVAWAEPDALYRAASLPDDPRLAEQWGLQNLGRVVGAGAGGIIAGLPALAGVDIGAPAAWAVTRGSPDVVVGVLDTGIRPEDPEFAGRLVTGCTLNGAAGALPVDDNGHGTHVASILAAGADDGVGIAGIAPGVRLMPIKVLGATGVGDAETIAAGVRCAAQAGLKVANMSLNGAASRVLAEALQASKSTLFVIAAGNEGSTGDGWGHSLCDLRFDNLVCVGALDPDGAAATYSNRSAVDVDLFAPGTQILGAMPHETLADDDFERPAGQGWSAIGAWTRIAVPGGHAVAAVPSAYDGVASNAIKLEDIIQEDEPAHGPPVWGCHLLAQVDVALDEPGDGVVLRESTTWTNHVDENNHFDPIDDPSFDDTGRTPARYKGLAEWDIAGDMQAYGASTYRLAVDAGATMTPDEHAVVDDVRIVCNGGDSPAGADDLAFLSGTSMAAPHVAGIAALVQSAMPGDTAGDLRARIICGATPDPRLTGLAITGARASAPGALAAEIVPGTARTSGRATLIAGGTDTPAADPTQAAGAPLPRILDLAVARDGTLLALTVDGALRLADGHWRRLAGTGTPGHGPDSGRALDVPLQPGAIGPDAISATADGGAVFTEAGRLRRLTPDGRLETLAGGRPADVVVLTDGGVAYRDDLLGKLIFLGGRSFDAADAADLAAGPDGSVIVLGTTVRRVQPDGTVTVLVDGDHVTGANAGDGGPAAAATFAGISHLAASGLGLLLEDRAGFRVRRIDADGRIDTVVGTGVTSPAAFTLPLPDDVPATDLAIFPELLAGAPDGTIYVVDAESTALYRIGPEQEPTTPHAPTCAASVAGGARPAVDGGVAGAGTPSATAPAGGGAAEGGSATTGDAPPQVAAAGGGGQRAWADQLRRPVVRRGPQGVALLVALPAHVGVVVRCAGAGCPFLRRSVPATDHARTARVTVPRVTRRTRFTLTWSHGADGVRRGTVTRAGGRIVVRF